MKFGKSIDFQINVVKGDILCVYYNFGTHSQVQYHRAIFEGFTDCVYLKHGDECGERDECGGCKGKIVITLPVAQTQRKLCARAGGNIRINIISQMLPEELFEI